MIQFYYLLIIIMSRTHIRKRVKKTRKMKGGGYPKGKPLDGSLGRKSGTGNPSVLDTSGKGLPLVQDTSGTVKSIKYRKNPGGNFFKFTEYGNGSTGYRTLYPTENTNGSSPRPQTGLSPALPTFANTIKRSQGWARRGKSNTNSAKIKSSGSSASSFIQSLQKPKVYVPPPDYIYPPPFINN
jgi:hypothetical protein